MTQGHVRALLPPPKADPSGTTAQGVRTRLLPRGGPRVGLQVHSAGAARDRARRTCSPWTLGPPPAASLAPRCTPASSPLLVPRRPRAGVSWVGEAARQGVPGQAGGRAATPMAGERGLAEGWPRGKARCLHHLTKDSPRLLPPPPCRRPRCIRVAGRPATALSSNLPKGSCHRRPLPQLLRTKASAHPPVAGPRGPAQGGRGGWAPIPAGTQPATGRGRLWPAHRGSGSKPQGGRAEAWSLDGGVQPGAGGGHRARMPREQRPAIPHGP